MLTPDDVVFVFVDVQGRLADIMHERDRLFDNLRRLALGMRRLQVPTLVTEQTKLGETREEFAEALAGAPRFGKSAFSCCGCEDFAQALQATGRKTVILAGIEAHICVYQTVHELTDQGYAVRVVADAVASRTALNRELGLQRCRELGASLVSTEMILLELLADSTHDAFRDILALIK